MKKIVILLALLICFSAFSACDDNNELIGKWATLEASDIAVVEMTYNFQNGGKLTISALFSEMEGSYKIDGDKLTISAMAAGVESKEEYTFEIKNNMLTLTNAESGEVTKLEKIKG